MFDACTCLSLVAYLVNDLILELYFAFARSLFMKLFEYFRSVLYKYTERVGVSTLSNYGYTN